MASVCLYALQTMPGHAPDELAHGYLEDHLPDQDQGSWIVCGDCAGRHCKPSCNPTYGFFILEELDYLCNLIGLQIQRQRADIGLRLRGKPTACSDCFSVRDILEEKL
ncbi:unnamed protein product [Pleuronectes platessa]|uniref:Uncharacterized protein n=1 Tax=Pleuronectes platessa TaxID=8262 RepID=A0A9N7Y6Z5_PLEPL|nr:unnamed protein product [Pleuronectes platessa]